MKQVLLLIFFIIFSTSSFACKFKSKIDLPFIYIAPCVTDQCIQTYLSSPISYQSRHCLATIEINGNKDWGYILGKKCRELKSAQEYVVRTEQTRCYKNSIPRRLFTSDYKVTEEENKQLKEYFVKNEIEPYKQDEVHLHLIPFGNCMADVVHKHNEAPKDHRHSVTGPLCR